MWHFNTFSACSLCAPKVVFFFLMLCLSLARHAALCAAPGCSNRCEAGGAPLAADDPHGADLRRPIRRPARAVHRCPRRRPGCILLGRGEVSTEHLHSCVRPGVVVAMSPAQHCFTLGCCGLVCRVLDSWMARFRAAHRIPVKGTPVSWILSYESQRPSSASSASCPTRAK